MKVHYRDNISNPPFLNEVSFLINALKNNNKDVFAYGSSIRNSFIIMSESIDDHTIIYDVEVTNNHVRIVKIDILKYQDKCFIYDGYYSRFFFRY